jgi:hypothetical protein
MLVDVTQNLQLRITPVNNPAKGDGFYRAVISHDYHALIQSQHITSAGKVPENVGYGEHRIASVSAMLALWDYENKFGDLCVTDTDNEFKE